MPKPFNLKYFESIKPLPMKRYALWLIGSPGYGFSIFNSMDKAIKAQDDDALAECEEAYPDESIWFTKHLEKHPDALTVQKNLFEL